MRLFLLAAFTFSTPCVTAIRHNLRNSDSVKDASHSQTRTHPHRKSKAMLLQDAAVEKRVETELEARMKFYPGMSSVEQLLKWNTSIAGPRMGQVKSRPQLTNGPRVLAMHDMNTGYNELSDNDYLMMFRSWEVVDIFVYFSHVHIAVPPIQWTMMAHEHGRPALGTLIFEWDKETTDFSQAIKSDRAQVLDQLVKLADHYGFDGWFFNNEGGDWQGDDPEAFVKELKEKMHKSDPDSMVIAYPYSPDDPMFQAADGVFVQYNWGTDDESMKRIAQAAGNRSSDVYMGLDAFGGRRGNDEPDPEHMKLCEKSKLSAAIFAPGFTFEIGANKTYSEEAVAYDQRWWSSIAENFGRPVANHLKNGNLWPIPPPGSSSESDSTAVGKPEEAEDTIDDDSENAETESDE